jgi:hypothetical protein
MGQGYHTNQVHYLRRAVAYTDDGTTLSLGWVPKGAAIIRGGVVVSTAFDSGTSDVLDLGFREAGDGTAADADEYGSALDLTTAGVIAADDMATAADAYLPQGAEITCDYTSAGTAPTAGAGVVWVEYLVDNGAA